jgi:hypothetical protein
MSTKFNAVSDLLDEHKSFYDKTRKQIALVIGRDEPYMGEHDEVDQRKGPNSDRETQMKEKEIPDKESEEKEKETGVDRAAKPRALIIGKFL